MKKVLSFLLCCGLFVLVTSCESDIFNANKYRAITGVAKNVTCCSAELAGSVWIPSTTPAHMSFGILFSKNAGVLFESADLFQPTVFDEDYNFTVFVKGLEPETEYYYRSFVYHDDEVTYGKTKSFTTPSLHLSAGAVDMGLSVKWAGCNVGATNPWDCGNYYAWGETAVKTDYTWGTYIWCNTETTLKLTKYNEADGKTQLDAADDVARTLGGTWRMPTDTEWTELRAETNCIWSWYRVNDMTGYLVTSKKTGNSIFLPAAGFYDGTQLKYLGVSGHYWSSSLIAGDLISVWNVDFNATSVTRDELGSRFGGLTVRPVCK